MSLATRPRCNYLFHTVCWLGGADNLQAGAMSKHPGRLRATSVRHARACNIARALKFRTIGLVSPRRVASAICAIGALPATAR
jgi:hypothetical protein